MIKKLVKYVVFAILLFLVVGFIFYVSINKPLPDGTQGVASEQLADKMLAALNKEEFDSLKFIAFTFANKHSYEWDRSNNHVTVRWEEQEIFLDLNRPVEEYSMLEFKAYKFFINDTFWLTAPFKVRDSGVVRSTVDVQEGNGLLVSYTSGGVTPGDSYLWIVDDQGFPIAWRLWTSNVPIGGLEFSWESWEKIDDVWFSTMHQSSILDLQISNLEVR